VRFLDERLTSDDARRWLRERGETRPDSGRVDQVAALLLLQEFLAEADRSSRA
jgi:RNase H-fold protein (predicted Holliday junction resolvase)